MFLSGKPRALEMIVDVPPITLNPIPNPNPNSPIDDPDLKSSTSCGAPKKRAETWVQDETRCLISLRRDMDSLFNTSKSNKHLWEQISARMKEKGFERSPTMCTDKWRNLLKEHKKARSSLSTTDRERNGSGGKVWGWTKEIEEILSERRRVSSLGQQLQPLKCSPVKVDSYMHFSDKGIEDAALSFGPVEGDQISLPSFKNVLIDRTLSNSLVSTQPKP